MKGSAATLTRREILTGSAIWAAILLAAGWWYFAPDDSVSPSQPAHAAERRTLSDREFHEMAQVAPARAKQIREATDRKALVTMMRDIEKLAAIALRSTDTKEFMIQQRYASMVMIRMAQLPNAADDSNAECVMAATDLDSLLGDVGSSFSSAQTEVAFEEGLARWRRSMPACEQAVGLKPVSRAL